MKIRLLLLLSLALLLSSVPGWAQTYQQVWADEFTTGVGPDWRFETGAGGWGNNERQYYQRANATVVNGELRITARRENVGGANYTSARMKTEGVRDFKYGRIEARMKLPQGQGLWPAFWMLGSNIGQVGWPSCGEIDIMEHVNSDSKVLGTAHWENNGHAEYSGNTNTSPQDYHVYSIEWEPTYIRWFVDGNKFHEINITNNTGGTEEFQRPFFLLLNLAVGGNLPGQNIDDTKFPATMYVDYVRVFQKTNNPPPPPTISGDPNLAGVYTLQNRNSGLNLEVASASTADRARVQQYQANGCTCQQFRLTHLGNGLYSIIAQHSGKGLDVNYVSQDNGAAIVQWPYVGGANQQFYAIGTGGGYYKLIAKHSGKAIEVASSSTANGALVQQYTDNGSPTQQWKLTPVGSPPPATFSRQLEAEAASVNNGMQVEACSEGGQDMGYVDAGDYLVWNAINFPTSGSYRIDYRVASGAGGGTISADLNGGSVPLGSTSIAGTGGWQNWTTVSRTVTINAGTYNFGIYAQTGGWNLNWVRLTKLAGVNAATATANVAGLEGETNALQPSALTLYPNPVTDRLNLATAGDLTGGHYQILDGRGRTVDQGATTGTSVNVAALAPGVYVLRLTRPGQAPVVRRFVK